MYVNQRSTVVKKESHPNPSTVSLLPLRPKTCVPRNRQTERESCKITSMFDSSDSEVVFLLSFVPSLYIFRKKNNNLSSGLEL